jgi:NitT/TauT family transport system permease protein
MAASKLPSAAPHLITGVKLAVAYCVIGVIAGEFILATAGLGHAIAFAYNDFDNKTMYGLLVLIVTLVIAINSLLHLSEQRLYARWRRR